MHPRFATIILDDTHSSYGRLNGNDNIHIKKRLYFHFISPTTTVLVARRHPEQFQVSLLKKTLQVNFKRYIKLAALCVLG